MLLLSCSSLSRGFDQGPLFKDVAFELHAGDRVGLVGPNGVGKTTLLRLLAGIDSPDDGEVRRHAGARVALLQQQPEFTPGRTLFEEAKSALDEFLAAQDDMVRTAEALARATDEAERKALAARYDRLHELLSHHDAFTLDHRVEEVLDGLGFRKEDYQRPVETLSGGQQSRLMLARLLLAAPDVMLLDEPSNHLDIAATRWLEDYLSRQPEAMVIVSHDRYFLDKVVNKVFELHARRLRTYPGNFQAYWRLRRERYEQELKAWEAQQEYIAKQEEYIRRVHYGQLHKQAQSRQKALDRLERLERPTLVEGPHMHFGEVKRSGDVVLRVDDLAKSYDRPLFAGLSFTLQRGQRLGIMGPNGSGKTTLLRILMGEEAPDRGTVQRGHLVEFGYYDQQLKSLPANEPVLRAVWPDPAPLTSTPLPRGQGREESCLPTPLPRGQGREESCLPTPLPRGQGRGEKHLLPSPPAGGEGERGEGVTEQKIRNLLARFGITGDQVHQRVGDLSGGERSRAALARLVALGANVLVLDEPTNHLDLWACDSLERALQEFEGTVIVVSHDRYFLNRVVDLLIVLEGDGRAQVVHGNYDTYERLRAQQEDEAPARKETPARASAAASAAVSRPKRKRRFPYRKVEELEADIAADEGRLRELEKLLASAELYRDGERVKETMRAFEETKARLQQLYEHWEEAVELN
ncbi:MAG TPA: ABC-F family ATP-binding cassette domain-containing protein [Gemmataceae bacterium]|nr:ABC-F family ATP-binding cassette domain-containing protein [Gemmataceae bacterium]